MADTPASPTLTADLSVASDGAAPPVASGLVGPAGIALVQHYEGCAKPLGDGTFAAYPDPATHADPWTIGWGTTGRDVKKGVVWTQAQCDARFANDIQAFAAQVAALTKPAATGQHRFDAMVSFAYNLGIANLGKSTLLKKHKAGDFAGAALEFGKWNKANGQVMPGLTARRAAEAALYKTPDGVAPPKVG